jgi:hypothetical protein
MLTRSSSKRKLGRKAVVKNKKGANLRSFSSQRSLPKVTQSITCSPISTHDDNLDENDDSSLGNDSLVIDCPDQHRHGIIFQFSKNYVFPVCVRSCIYSKGDGSF